MHVSEGRGHGVEIKGSGGGEGMFTDKVVLKLDFEISVQYFSMKKDKEPQSRENGMRRGEAKGLTFRQQQEIPFC